MPLITLTGGIGSGAQEIGAEVAHKLGIEYVDRLILAEAARKIGTSVAVVADKTECPSTLGDRISGFLRIVLERSAIAEPSSDPYYGAGSDALLIQEYQDMQDESLKSNDEVGGSRMLEVTCTVMTELAQAGNVVIIGRGSNIILKDWPGALHVGLTAPLETRIDRIMERQHLQWEEAEHYLCEIDRGRTAYFRRFFHSHPDDSMAFHLLINTALVDLASASKLIVGASQTIEGARESNDLSPGPAPQEVG